MLEAAIGPRTRYLLLCNPLNPTATMSSAAELATIADFCVAHDLVAICDEVWEHVTFDGARQITEMVGRHLLKEHPKEITMEWATQKRTGKIFIDHNMNVRGKTLRVAYSPCGSPGATVSSAAALRRRGRFTGVAGASAASAASVGGGASVAAAPSCTGLSAALRVVRRRRTGASCAAGSCASLLAFAAPSLTSGAGKLSSGAFMRVGVKPGVVTMVHRR